MYLAGGGDPLAQGTDTVRAMLTPNEFVVKEKSASFDRGFLSAYNDNPAAALKAVRQGGENSSSERPIYADGIGLIGWVRQLAGREAQLVFNSGMDRVARELNGGLV